MQQQRSYEVDWRFISLWIVNEENTAEWYTPAYRAGHFMGHRGLRIANAIRQAEDNEAVGRWYTTVGTAYHAERRRDEARADADSFYETMLDDAGFSVGYLAAADDESHDDRIRADTELALGRVGDDVGTPILTFRPGTEAEGSFFGPVIAKAPKGPDALRLWDAVETLATSGVAELKRSLRGTPDYT